jgi:hypothetical protein
MALSTTMARVRNRVDLLKSSAKISSRQIAILLDMSPAVFGNVLAGVTYLGSGRELELDQATALLVTLEEAVYPLRLPENPDAFRRLVDRVRDKKVDLDAVRAVINDAFGGNQ